MLSCRAVAPRGSDTALPCSLSSPRGAWGHWESKIGRTLLGHCHGDMGSLCPAEAGQGPPARPSLPDMGLDKPNPSSPWHGCPRAATLPACASNRDGAGAGTTRVFCSRCPRAMAQSHPFTSTPPALSLLSVFSTQKGVAAADGVGWAAVNGCRRGDAARGQLGAAAGTPVPSGLLTLALGSDEVSLSLCLSPCPLQIPGCV